MNHFKYIFFFFLITKDTNVITTTQAGNCGRYHSGSILFNATDATEFRFKKQQISLLDICANDYIELIFASM